MGNIFKTEKRRVIPKWRSIEVASQTGELKLPAIAIPNKSFDISVLKDQINAFKNNQDLLHAGDLFSAAFVLGLENEFAHVAEFILNNSNESSNSLLNLARKVLYTKPNTEIKIENEDNNTLKHRASIQKYRHYLKKEPRNPLAWCELGRLYSLVAEPEKAKRCMDAALYLDKNNRFIVRSASRFYHHYDKDSEHAIAIIKKSEFAKYDPWLMSAEIGYSSILERKSTMAKTGMDFLKYSSHNDFDITELASSLGTLEFFNGKVRQAKKYINQSLLKPNDNSIAQAKWMSDGMNGLDIVIHNYNIPLAFEADAITALEQENYSQALQSSISWIDDEPYSTRPVKVASYIQSIFFNQNNTAISILRRGLEVNPNDLMLNNNLVYVLIRKGNIEEAVKVFKKKIFPRIASSDDVSKLFLTATTGLLFYKDNLPDEGRKMYQRAIELAKAANNEYLVALATVHYLKEEVEHIKIKSELSHEIKYLKNYFEHNHSPDINIFYKEFLLKYNQVPV